MRKILCGILAFFMSLAMICGTAFIVADYLPTSTEIVEDDEKSSTEDNVTNKSATSTSNWIDVVNDDSRDYFIKYGGKNEYNEYGKVVTAIIPEETATKYTHVPVIINGFTVYESVSNASLALAGALLCTRLWEDWRNCTIKIECDIDMGLCLWSPIGCGVYGSANQYGGPFQGTFDGQGHTISNVYINYTSAKTFKEENYLIPDRISDDYTKNKNEVATGFFGYVKDATIQNFSITGGIYFYNSAGDKKQYNDKTTSLGVIGRADDSQTIRNIFNDGFSIYYSRRGKEPFFSKDLYVGGIVGSTHGNTCLRNCVNRSGEIDIYSYGALNNLSSANYMIGGIVGLFGSSWIYDCANFAVIWLRNEDNNSYDGYDTLSIGGVVGGVCVLSDYSKTDKGNVDISRSTNSGEIDLDKYKFDCSMITCGGIVGSSYKTIGKSKSKNLSLNVDDCHNYGNIIGNSQKLSAGGVIGYSGAYLHLTNSSNFGNLNISASSSNNNDNGFGGILGVSDTYGTYILTCVNYGDISRTSGSKEIKYVGGIVGHIWNDGNVVENMNYGSVSGTKCVGGIAGELGRYDLFNSYKNLVLANCINYSIHIVGDEYVGQLAGYIEGNDVVKGGCCAVLNNAPKAVGNKDKANPSKWLYYSLDTILGYNFITSSSRVWYEGYMNDDYTNCLDYSFINSEYEHPSFAGYSYYKDWLCSTVAFSYFSENQWIGKGYKTAHYSWVPYNAVLSMRIGVDYRKNTTSNYEYYYDISDFGTFETYQVYEYSKNVYSSKVLNTDYIQVLNGADYTLATIRSSYVLQYNIKDNYFQTDGAYLQTTFADGSKFVNNVTLVSQTKTNFKTFSLYDYGTEIVLRPTLVFKFTGIKNPIGVSHFGGRNNEYDYSSDPSVICSNCSFYDTDGNITTKFAYQETVTISIKPNIGFYVTNISTKKGTQETSIFSSSNTYGTVTASFVFKLEDKIIVQYNKVSYTITFTDGENTLLQTEGEVNWPNREDATSISLNNSNVNDVNDNSFMEFGYKYSFKVNGKDNFKENIEPTGQNRSITISADEFIGTGTKQMSDITANTITIIVTRTAIEYKVYLKTYANAYNSDVYTESTNGGTAKLDSKKITLNPTPLTVEDTLELLRTAKTGYSIGKFTIKDTKSNEEVTENYNKEYSESMQSIVDKFVSQYYSNDPSKWTDHELTISAYFDLNKYNLSIGVRGSTVKPKITINDGTGVINDTIENREIKYFTPISIEVPETYHNRRFVGFYSVSTDGKNTYQLLSLNTTYNFLVNPNTNVNQNTDSLTSLSIVAKYQQYSTTSNIDDFTSYYSTTSSPDAKGVYKISTADDLVLLSQKVQAGNTFENVMFVQTENIDMSSITSFNPIGTSATPFKGVYDGGNYTISNLKFVGENELSNIGLFGCTNGATIKNLTIQNSDFTGYAYAGALVGKAINTTFERVNNYNSNLATGDLAFYDVYGEFVYGCEVDNKLTYPGKIYYYHKSSDSTPELVGVANVSNTFAARQYFAGLVGYAEDCSFYASSSKADVTGTGCNGVAGLVGGGSGCTIDQCFVIGTLNDITNTDTTNTDTTNVIANNATIKDCFYRESDSSTTTTILEKTKDSLWITVNGRDNLKVFYWS